MYFFTSDEHLNHNKPFIYEKRGFPSVAEMNAAILQRHNLVVDKKDTVVHIGDYAFGHPNQVFDFIQQLNGHHIFIPGSHDRWIKNQWLGRGSYKHIWESGRVTVVFARDIWSRTVEGQHIVGCHYSMRTWPRSHYGSWLVYGPSHNGLPPLGKSVNVAVDLHDFYPVSFIQLKDMMDKLPDNFNMLRNPRRT